MSKPVAWIPKGMTLAKPKDLTDCIPLYTHPVKQFNATELAAKILTELGFSQEPSREEGIDSRRDRVVAIIKEITE